MHNAKALAGTAQCTPYMIHVPGDSSILRDALSPWNTVPSQYPVESPDSLWLSSEYGRLWITDFCFPGADNGTRAIGSGQ